VSIEDRGRTAGRATVVTFEASTDVGQDYAELVRRRRSQRRTRMAALAIVAVTVVVAVFSARGGLRAGPPPQPVQPPPTHGVGLTAPLIAPKSLLDVRTLGFRVEPVSGFDAAGLGAGWSIENDGQQVTLRWDEVRDQVDVTVLYQGQPAPLYLGEWGHVEDVTIHGASGHYVQQPWGLIASIGGDFNAAVEWEYAPDSWAWVSAFSDRGDPGPQRLRAALIEVAEAVAAGGVPVRVPVRMHPFTSSMPEVSTLSGMGVHRRSGGWEGRLEFGKLGITAGPATVPEVCDMYGGSETFTYQGHSGCVAGEGGTDQPPPGTAFNSVYAVALQVGDAVRVADVRGRGLGVPNASNTDWFAYHIKEWKQLLAGLTVAQLDDETTWVDVRAAAGM
jgi:hypothetical protein